MTNFQTSLDRYILKINEFNQKLKEIDISIQQSAERLNIINTEIQFNIDQLKHQVEKNDQDNAINQMFT